MIRWSAYPLLFVLAMGLFESVLLGYSYFIILAALLFFTVAADIIGFHLRSVPAMKTVIVRRTVARSEQPGAFEITLEFSRTGMGLLPLRYYEGLSDGLTADGAWSGYAVFRGRGNVVRRYRVSSYYFGRHGVGPTTLAISDAFGLCYFSVRTGQEEYVSIPPRLSETGGVRGEPLRRTAPLIGANTTPRAGQGYQFLTIRPYTVHDDSRRIAWNRFGQVSGEDVYVKEMEDERTTDTIFLIDFGGSTDIGQLDRIYCSQISSALRASSAICRQGDRVGYFLYSSSRCFFVPPAASFQSAKELQLILKQTEPDGYFSLPSALRELKRRYPRAALIIAISPLLHREAAISSASEGLSLVQHRSLKVIVPDASSYFEKEPGEASPALMTYLLEGQRWKPGSAVKLLSGMGIETIISSSRTLLADISRVWYEGRDSIAGF